jgi:hypothetical protein
MGLTARYGWRLCVSSVTCQRLHPWYDYYRRWRLDGKIITQNFYKKKPAFSVKKSAGLFFNAIEAKL